MYVNSRLPIKHNEYLFTFFNFEIHTSLKPFFNEFKVKNYFLSRFIQSDTFLILIPFFQEMPIFFFEGIWSGMSPFYGSFE